MVDISGTDSLPGIVLCIRGSPRPEESAVRGKTITVQCDKVYHRESIGHCGATEGRVFICHGQMGKGRLEWVWEDGQTICSEASFWDPPSFLKP